MSYKILERMIAERDRNGELVVTDDDVPVPTWVAPVAIPFYKAERPVSKEQALWRGVAARMVLDALGFTNTLGKGRNEHIKTIADAQQWFRYDDADVEEVFYLAGVPKEPVLAALFSLLDTKDAFNVAAGS